MAGWKMLSISISCLQSSNFHIYKWRTGHLKKEHLKKLNSFSNSLEIMTFSNIYGNEPVVIYNSVSFSFLMEVQGCPVSDCADIK